MKENAVMELHVENGSQPLENASNPNPQWVSDADHGRGPLFLFTRGNFIHGYVRLVGGIRTKTPSAYPICQML